MVGKRKPTIHTIALYFFTFIQADRNENEQEEN